MSKPVSTDQGLPVVHKGPRLDDLQCVGFCGGFDMGKYGVYFKTATDDFFRWLSRNTSQETDLTIYSRYCKKVLTISTYLKHLGIFHNACSEALASSQA